MNVLEKAEHELKNSITKALRKLNDDEPEQAVKSLQAATEAVNEVSSVVLQLEGKIISLGRIIPEASKIINNGKNDDAREFLREIREALSP